MSTCWYLLGRNTLKLTSQGTSFSRATRPPPGPSKIWSRGPVISKWDPCQGDTEKIARLERLDVSWQAYRHPRISASLSLLHLLIAVLQPHCHIFSPELCNYIQLPMPSHVVAANLAAWHKCWHSEANPRVWKEKLRTLDRTPVTHFSSFALGAGKQQQSCTNADSPQTRRKHQGKHVDMLLSVRAHAASSYGQNKVNYEIRADKSSCLAEACTLNEVLPLHPAVACRSCRNV